MLLYSAEFRILRLIFYENPASKSWIQKQSWKLFSLPMQSTSIDMMTVVLNAHPVSTHNHLRENGIQKFHFGRYIIGSTVVNLVLWLHKSQF